MKYLRSPAGYPGMVKGKHVFLCRSPLLSQQGFLGGVRWRASGRFSSSRKGLSKETTESKKRPMAR
eukprot:5714386-Lingulodinium_polyedra.AAC.1